MRIAQIAPLGLSLPPKKYGGTERVIATLTEELVRRGHEVTLFASGDSKTSAYLHSVCPEALPARDEYEQKNKVFDIYQHTAMNVLNISTAYRMQDEFDIIHDHTAQNYPVSLALAEYSRVPVVITLHGAFTRSTTSMFTFFTKPYYVSISKAQVQSTPLINHAGTVYHGLEMEHYPFGRVSEGYLLYVGRISVEKGVHHAISVADALDLPLIIAGSPDLNYKNYMETAILPHLSDKILWIGEVDEKRRNKLMSKALCLLHPITWSEPFGLTMIEAMACGTPVVAFNRGSVSEVVKDRVSGYVVDTLPEMIEAVKKVPLLSRRVTRDYALTQFTPRKMVDGYERIYRRVLRDKIKEVRSPAISRPSSVQPLSEFVFSPDFS